MSSPMETPAPPAGADFPDWLSPMLVKELRQGVRTRVFVALFILLQVAMLLTVSLTLLVAAHGLDTSTGTGFFWVFVGLPVLVVPAAQRNRRDQRRDQGQHARTDFPHPADGLPHRGREVARHLRAVPPFRQRRAALPRAALLHRRHQSRRRTGSARLDARGFGGALRLLHGAVRLPGAHRPRGGGRLVRVVFRREHRGRRAVWPWRGAWPGAGSGRDRGPAPVRRDRPGADAGGGRGADRASRREPFRG